MLDNIISSNLKFSCTEPSIATDDVSHSLELYCRGPVYIYDLKADENYEQIDQSLHAFLI